MTEGDQKGKAVDGGTVVRGEVGDEDRTRDTVDEANKRGGERETLILEGELEGIAHDGT